MSLTALVVVVVVVVVVYRVQVYHDGDNYLRVIHIENLYCVLNRPIEKASRLIRKVIIRNVDIDRKGT